jgi:23S rRNA (uracil1939-C5)-methyltransferase
VTPSPKEYGYRNRITVHRRGGRVGFHQRAGQGLVDIERCLLASEPVNKALERIRSDRRSRDGEAVTLREHGGRFGFHQTNDDVAALLLDAVDAVCGEGGPLLIDAYCGAGFFSRRLAGKFGKVVGIEWNEGSVAIARSAAGENEEYLAGDVADRLAEVLRHPERARGIVVVDPPAQGLDERVVAALVECPVARVIYVSCDPSTLARDLPALGAAYDFKFAQPFDMFPQTAEVEVMVVLEAKDGAKP